MTLTQFAEAANVPLKIIVDFEIGSLQPKPEHIEATRKALEERRVEFANGDPPSARLKL